MIRDGRDTGETVATVGAGALVDDDARLGRDVVIGRNALVDRGVIIGDGVTIDTGALVYAGATLEGDVLVGPGAILTNDRYPRAIRTAQDVEVSQEKIGGGITVRHGATVGAGAVIVAAVEIGRFALVGAGAVVTRSVPPHALVVGNPARRLGWVCACGMRLVDSDGDPAPAEPAHYSRDSALHCPSCGRVYTYVPDAETVEEASGPREGMPA